MTVHHTDRIRRWIREAIQRLDDIARVYDREYTTAPWPPRRGEPTALAAGTYSDPTGQTAVAHREWLEQRAAEIVDVASQIADIHTRIGAAPPPQPEVRRCTHDDCTQPHVANGLCRTHYQRQYRQRQEPA